MRQKQVSENSITSGVIWKQLLIFFFPILIGTFFQQLYNTVDTIVVGQYVGTNALAAVGTTGTLINLLVGFFVGVSSGATVIISQFFGAGDGKNVSKAVHTSMALALVGGLFIMVFGLLTSRPSLELLGVPEEIMDDALTYLNVYYAGIIASMIYNVGTGVLRAIGDSRMPLYVLIVCCLVNIVLDLLFVLAFHWDVFGVAFATVLSQVVSAVLIMLRLMLTRESYRVELKKIRFDRSILKNVIRIGLPAGLQSGAVLHLQPGGAGLHQLLRHRRHRLLGGHRQDRRLYLDGDERLRHRHHHLCGAELRGPEVRPGQAEHQGLPGDGPGHHHRPVRFALGIHGAPAPVLHRGRGGHRDRPAVLLGAGPQLLHLRVHRDPLRRHPGGGGRPSSPCSSPASGCAACGFCG